MVFLCNFSIPNDHGKWKFDQLGVWGGFFGSPKTVRCKIVESGSGHPVLGVYKLRKLSIKISKRIQKVNVQL